MAKKRDLLQKSGKKNAKFFKKVVFLNQIIFFLTIDTYNKNPYNGKTHAIC